MRPRVESPGIPEDAIRLLAETDERAERLLKASKDNTNSPWKPLLGHLRFTHLFPQSARLRMASLLPSERWKLLAGPLDAGELAEMNYRLSSRGLTNALSRLLEHATARTKDSETALAAWQKRRALRDRLRAAACGSNAISPGEVVEQLARVSTDPEVEGALAGLLSADPAPRRWLEAFQRSLDLAAQSIANREQQLKDASALPQPWAAGSSRHAEAQATAEAERTQIAWLSQATSESRAKRDAAGEVVRNTEDQVLAARSVREGLRTQQARLSEIATLEVEESGLQSNMEKARNAETAAAESEQQVRGALERRGDMVSARHLLMLRLKHWEAQSDAVERFASRDAGKAGVSDRRAALATDIEKQLAGRAAEQAKLVEVLAERKDLGERVSRLVESADSMAKAVAEIAALLTIDRRDCPVCGAVHDLGQLKAKAEHAARCLDPEVARLRALLADMDRDIAVRLQDIGERTNGIEAKEQARDQLDRELAALEEERGQLAAELSTNGTPVLLREALGREISGAREALAGADAELLNQLSQVELEGALHERRRERSEAQTRVQQCMGRFREIAERLAVLKALVAGASRDSAMDSEPKRLAERLIELSTELERLEALARAQREPLVTIEQELARSLEALHKSEQSLASQARETKGLEVTLSSQLRAWKDLELPGEPGEAGLVEAQSKLAARRARVAELEALRRSLDLGLAASEQLTELNDADKDLESERGPRTEDDHELHLSSIIDAARASEQRVQGSQEERDWLTKNLTAEEKDFNLRVQKPLEAGMRAYWQALSSSDDLEIELDVKTTGTTRRQYSVVRKAGTADPAALIASEGEFATLTLCMLLAASTRYRWSRWRALLLDDPLGHCDSIKAVGLVDLLRNLALHEGYQIIFSTHDDHLGGYISRKMRAAGVDCRRYHFDRSGRDSGTIVTSA